MLTFADFLVREFRIMTEKNDTIIQPTDFTLKDLEQHVRGALYRCTSVSGIFMRVAGSVPSSELGRAPSLRVSCGDTLMFLGAGRHVSIDGSGKTDSFLFFLWKDKILYHHETEFYVSKFQPDFDTRALMFFNWFLEPVLHIMTI